MTRAERLLALLQSLRARRRPVDGATLAAETGVSLRTVYRDIDALRAQGARIDGEAGVGYVLRPGFLLPPLMLSPDAAAALALGARCVAARGDAALAEAAEAARAKISAVLPEAAAREVEDSALMIGPRFAPPYAVDAQILRGAIRAGRALRIAYADAEGRETVRDIWPVTLAFFDAVEVVAAWCALRGGFRNFRADRIRSAETLGRYPRRRADLEREWRAQLRPMPPAKATDKS